MAMSKIKHTNVLSLIEILPTQQNEIIDIVLPYCEKGKVIFLTTCLGNLYNYVMNLPGQRFDEFSAKKAFF